MSPELEIQGAMVSRLKGEGLTVYDHVPEGAVFPYVTIGPCNMVSDDADCLIGFEAYFDIDCWSRAPGYPEVKALADQVRRAFSDGDLDSPAYEIELTENAAVVFEHRITRIMRDPDGLTSRAAITFKAIIEQY